MLMLPHLGKSLPKKLWAQNINFSAWFRTTLRRDREYLQIGTRYRRLDNGVANCDHSRTCLPNLVGEKLHKHIKHITDVLEQTSTYRLIAVLNLIKCGCQTECKTKDGVTVTKTLCHAHCTPICKCYGLSICIHNPDYRQVDDDGSDAEWMCLCQLLVIMLISSLSSTVLNPFLWPWNSECKWKCRPTCTKTCVNYIIL